MEGFYFMWRYQTRGFFHTSPVQQVLSFYYPPGYCFCADPEAPPNLDNVSN